jgi:hypothetical protein
MNNEWKLFGEQNNLILGIFGEKVKIKKSFE